VSRLVHEPDHRAPNSRSGSVAGTSARFSEWPKARPTPETAVFDFSTARSRENGCPSTGPPSRQAVSHRTREAVEDVEALGELELAIAPSQANATCDVLPMAIVCIGRKRCKKKRRPPDP